MRPNVMVAMSVLVVFVAAVPGLGDPVDVDKSHDGAGGWGTNFFNDLNEDLDHDPGEPFADNPELGWIVGHVSDKSCWLASACNMLQQAGLIDNAQDLYNEYALNGVPSPLGGMLTWDEGGFQNYAIEHWLIQHPNDPNAAGADIRIFETDAEEGPDGAYSWDMDVAALVENHLNAGWQVGIAMKELQPGVGGDPPAHGEIGHAITIQAMVAGAFECTDSDRDWDLFAPGDVNTYADWTWTAEGGGAPYTWVNEYYGGTVEALPWGDVYYVCALIPEPGTLALACFGCLVLMRRRR